MRRPLAVLVLAATAASLVGCSASEEGDVQTEQVRTYRDRELRCQTSRSSYQYQVPTCDFDRFYTDNPDLAAADAAGGAARLKNGAPAPARAVAPASADTDSRESQETRVYRGRELHCVASLTAYQYWVGDCDYVRFYADNPDLAEADAAASKVRLKYGQGSRPAESAN